MGAIFLTKNVATLSFGYTPNHESIKVIPKREEARDTLGIDMNRVFRQVNVNAHSPNFNSEFLGTGAKADVKALPEYLPCGIFGD